MLYPINGKFIEDLLPFFKVNALKPKRRGLDFLLAL